MFSRILVANRGEIAVRIIQACHELDIAAVAVYSVVDANALHVRSADEAICIGPAPAVESYLNVPRIVEAALESESKAVHPGYGFLAENPNFARAVLEKGLTWIGPDPDVIALLGDKVAAKGLAASVGVPTVPGSVSDDQTPAGLQAEAAAIGFPVMIKAVAGGGGKGMRVVHDPAQLATAVEAAKREASSAFGDDRIFLERAIVRPRHVEVQILLDNFGDGVYLGERECSLQRRHQKVVEESPSPILTGDLRRAMGEDALRLARAARYTNAGTVEFLFAGDRYYFLEVNTRIQVEHPVSEAVTGIDLVRKQIEVAAGTPLGLSQLDVTPRGHAVEVRVYAEDPPSGFLPSTGRVIAFAPPEGPGVRNDVGIEVGSSVTPFYDPLLAKLIVHDRTRGDAVRRLVAALSQYSLTGLTTNLGFLRWISEQTWFHAGHYDVETLPEAWQPVSQSAPPAEVLVAAAAFSMAGSSHGSDDTPVNPWHGASAWRSAGMPRSFRFEIDGIVHSVTLTQEAGYSWRANVDAQLRQFAIERGANGRLVLKEGTAVWPASVAAVAAGVSVQHGGQTYLLRRPSLDARHETERAASSDSLVAPMPGTVVKIAVCAGERVTAHQPLVVLEAMKMEHVIEAPHDGVVREVLFQEGELVPAGEPVVRLEGT